MNPILEKCLNAKNYIENTIDFKPEIGIVLGSGLGNYAEKIDVKYELSYSDIPGMPVSTVPGHDGKYIFGYVGDKKVVAMKGRVHYYEGYPMSDTVMPYRVMALIGCKTVILTNAVGGINLSYEVGDLMIIKDHISLFTPSPLIGQNIDEFGLRFPDMSNIYNKELRAKIKESADELGMVIREGVFVQCTGPQFETPAEIRMLRTLGADSVGMSTGIEAITLNHMSVKVCAISCIANMAAGILDEALSDDDVKAVGKMVSSKFEALVTRLISKI